MVTRGRPPEGTNSTSDSLSNLLAASPSALEGGPNTTPGSGLAHATVLLKATSEDLTPTSMLGEVQDGENLQVWILVAGCHWQSRPGALDFNLNFCSNEKLYNDRW